MSPDDLASITPLWQQAVAQTLIPVVAEVFHASAGVVHARMVDATQVPTLPSIGSLAAEQYLAQAANTFAEVGDRLWATARSELLDGFEKGESIPQLADRLRASAGMTAKTATLVARTQVLDASNAGSIATARATGLELRKGWLDTPDQRTRPTHHQAGNTYGSDQGMIPLGDQFTVGGYQCDRPHDPTLPPAEKFNCRCALIYSMVDAAVDEAVRAAEPVPPLPGEVPLPTPLPDVYAGDLVAPALPGPDVGIPGAPAPLPGLAVRPSLEAARTTYAVQGVFIQEARQITGRFLSVRFTGSAATAREHAEGLLRGLERFPDAKLAGIDAMEARGSEYAATAYSEILFSETWTSPAARRRYLSSVAADVENGWHVANSGSPVSIALHEFGHLLDFTTDINRTIRGPVRQIVARRAAEAGVAPDVLIAREVSQYATSHVDELVAEAFTDVMVNGEAASVLSKDIFTLLEAAYRQAGGTVRAVSREVALAVPSPASALAAKTVPQLRALAKERGITIPAGSKKADIIRLLDEGAPPRLGGIPKYEPPASLTAAERDRASRLVRADPQIIATVRDRFDPISTSGNLSDGDAAWLQSIYKREPAFVERLAQTAQIERNLRDKARKAGQSLAEYRKQTAARLKAIVDEKPLVVRVTDDRALTRILADGRFKTQFDAGIRRAPGLEVGVERRRLGEQILGIAPDVPAEERPVYGFVAIRGVEPALEAGRKIPGIAQLEGQEDILSAYGKVQVVLKPTVRSRTTITVGDSLDEIGFMRPSPIDSPLAESVGVRNLDRVTEPGWTRTGYIEAQIHGGVRVDDIEMVVFAQDPSAALAGELRARGIRYQVLGRDDQPVFPSSVSPPAVPVPAVEVPLAKRTVAQLRALAADRKITIPAGARKLDIVRLLEAPPLTQAEERAAARAAARETNRLIEESTANAQVLAEVDALLAKKAPAATIREALDAALVEPGQLFAGADPAILAALRAVAADPVKLRAAVTRLGGKIKVKPVSKAGAKVTFDADTMEGVGGIDIPAGAKVTVVRRGSTVTLPDGTVMQLEKARVTPVAAPVEAAPVKVVSARKATVSDYSGRYEQRQAELRTSHGGEPTVMRLEGGIASDVELLTYPDGFRLVRKDYQKKGEAPHRSDQVKADAEELAARVLDAFDLPTPAVIRVNPHTVEMEFVDGVQGGVSGVLKAPAAVVQSEQGRRLGLADAVMGLRDRNGGGWMRVGDGIVPIDNGGAFGGVGSDQAAYGNPFTGFLMTRYAWKRDVDIDLAWLATVRARLVALRPEFVRLLDGARLHKDMLARLDEIAQRARPGSGITPIAAPAKLEKARITPVAAPAKKAAPAKRTPAPKASPSQRQPGRDLLPTSTAKAEPVEVLKAAAQRDLWVDRAALKQREGGPVVHVLTTAVRQQDGWSTPARVVTPAQLDRLVDSGWTEMWRGVYANHTGVPSISATDIARATRTGDWQMTRGIYGNGVYTTARRTTAEMYRGGTIPDFDFRRGIPAESFGPAPMYEYLPGLTPSPQGTGGLMRMVLDPDAKIIDYEDLRAEHREFLSSEAYHSMPYGAFKRELGDSSFYAVMRGYDGIRVHGPHHNDGAIYPEGVTNRDEPPQWVIFNRSVLVFERASKRYDT